MATAAAAGYSGKPIWQKLGLDAKHRVLVRGAPSDYAKLVGLRADDLTFATSRGAFDIAHVFETSAETLRRELGTLAKKLPAAGTIWVSWPKKSAKIPTDLDENIIRDFGLKNGLVDVKVCAVSEVWSGLKLVVPLSKR